MLRGKIQIEARSSGRFHLYMILGNANQSVVPETRTGVAWGWWWGEQGREKLQMGTGLSGGESYINFHNCHDGFCRCTHQNLLNSILSKLMCSLLHVYFTSIKLLLKKEREKKRIQIGKEKADLSLFPYYMFISVENLMESILKKQNLLELTSEQACLAKLQDTCQYTEIN